MDGRTDEATLSPAELPPYPLQDVEEPLPLSEPEAVPAVNPRRSTQLWEKLGQHVKDPSDSLPEPVPAVDPERPRQLWERLSQTAYDESLLADLASTLDNQEGKGQRVTIVEQENDASSETSTVPVDECAVCRHLFNNYATEEEVENGLSSDQRLHIVCKAPFAQYWREKEMIDDKEGKSRPALCSFHALYKERHDFLSHILEQRRQNCRLTTAELAAMLKVDGGTNDENYLKCVESIVKRHFKIVRENVMRGLAVEARQLRSHWETTKDRQDQDIVEDLSDMQKRHQLEIKKQRASIRSELSRKKLHYNAELLSSFEHEKYLLEKQDWANARNEAVRATEVEKHARRQFQVEIEQTGKRREEWARTILERQRCSRIDRCTRRRQMGAVARASDGERLYQRLEQTTQRLERAHATEMRKVRAHFAEHVSRMSHIVERTARGSGIQEAEHHRPLYETPVRLPFKAEEAPGGSQPQRPKSAGAKVNMSRSLPGEFASKVLAEEMRISMHRKLAAASRMRRSGSAPEGKPVAQAGTTRISAARPPSANSRIANPIAQKMAGLSRQRPRSAGALGRQKWSQETDGKGIYGTQWAQAREGLRCDFCGKRASNPRLLPASKTEQQGDPICVGCSWECLRQWNAKLSPPFLRGARVDLIQDLCGQEALKVAAEAGLDQSP